MSQKKNFSRVELSELRRKTVLANVQEFFMNEFDTELSIFKAITLTDFFVSEIGAPIYNKGVQDATRILSERTSHVESELYEQEVALRPVDPL
jgi:uncharacterized protein (DUF2164 family)